MCIYEVGTYIYKHSHLPGVTTLLLYTYIFVQL
jgi:hypothetical protein